MDNDIHTAPEPDQSVTTPPSNAPPAVIQPTQGDDSPKPSIGYQPPEPPPHKDHEGAKNVISTIAILVIAPLIALCLTAFVFQSYEVDGPSMETTLQNHDRLIVLKVPRTLAKITGHPYIPHRGDIVIFSKSDLYSFEDEAKKQLIKRVIGLPGERVVVKDGFLTVYNKEHPDGFQPDKTMSYGSAIVTTTGNIDLTVPENEVFVCGDNRNNSLDSRAFGTVEAKDIVGKLSIRLIPFNKVKTF